MVELKIKLPENFLDEENRCGYTVSGEMKKVWAVELDLLAALDAVCKSNNLKYCIAAGTLLGAVRHKGFIPWDDDIDIYMLREDYDKLIQLDKEFKFPYFLQTTYSEKKLFRTHAQLRNSDTTGCIETDCYQDINRGIFIDIFPLDGINPNIKKNKVQKKVNDIYVMLLSTYNAAVSEKLTIKKRIKGLIGRGIFALVHKEVLFQRYEDNLKRYSDKSFLMWGNRTLVFECPKSRRPVSDWLNLTTMPFEFINVPVPCNYDEILRQQYGDYMKIPKDKGGSMHGGLTISIEQSYKEYFSQEN